MATNGVAIRFFNFENNIVCFFDCKDLKIRLSEQYSRTARIQGTCKKDRKSLFLQRISRKVKVKDALPSSQSTYGILIS